MSSLSELAPFPGKQLYEVIVAALRSAGLGEVSVKPPTKIYAAQITVATTPVSLPGNASIGFESAAGVIISNDGPSPVIVNGGFKLYSGDTIAIPIDDPAKITLAAETGTSTVYIIAVGW